jgi:type IV fimbrial biogenesis protein FimT
MTRIHTSSTAAARSAGFTIIELMVTIAVLAVLLSIGVPAFNDMIRNNRIAAQTNAVVGALNYARGETATRGAPVSICAAEDAGDDPEGPDTCSTANDWQFGWIIFTDRVGTQGMIDVGDEILQTGGAPVNGFNLQVTDSFVRFGVGSSPSTARTLTITPTETGFCATTGSRIINVGNTGRVNTAKGSC